jgi:outer membrane immunogenic protein
MRRLGILLASTSALVAFGSPSFAADLPVKAVRAPVAAPVAAYDWTGWYAGGNLGYSWGRARSDFDVPGFVFDANGPLALGGILDVPGVAGSDKVNLNGIVGGGQLGYNWQTSSNWLLGIEADFQWTGEKGSRALSADPIAFTIIGEGSGTIDSETNYTAKIQWFGTVRGRLGFVADHLLFYGTGGFAYGNVKVSGVNTTSIAFNNGVTTTTTDFVTPFSESKTKTGWTAGVGVEGVSWWDARWTWRLEYLFVDLGRLHTAAATPSGDFLTVSTKFTDHIARVGLNYRF